MTLYDLMAVAGVAMVGIGSAVVHARAKLRGAELTVGCLLIATGAYICAIGASMRG